MATENREVRHEIVEQIAVLGTNASKWCKECNLVSWNGGPAKYDIRDWDPNHEKCGKGITLNDAEIEELKNALNSRF